MTSSVVCLKGLVLIALFFLTLIDIVSHSVNGSNSQSCPKTLCFNTQKNSCQPMGSEGCEGDEENGRSFGSCRQPTRQEQASAETCAAVVNLPLKQNECRLYQKCFKAGVRPTFSCCPQNQNFDHFVRRCVNTKNARCMNVCPKKGLKYGDPSLPNEYMECTSKGYPEIKFCPKGQTFKMNNKTCSVGVEEKPQTNDKMRGQGKKNTKRGPKELASPPPQPNTPPGAPVTPPDEPTAAQQEATIKSPPSHEANAAGDNESVTDEPF